MGESADGMSNATVSDGPFREYWDPWTGEAHGTGGFSWTAALFFDTFCAPPITPPLLVTSKPVAAAVPEVPHETLSDAESPSIALPLAGVAGAVLAWGSFTLPMKSKAVLDAHLDPLIFQYADHSLPSTRFLALIFEHGTAYSYARPRLTLPCSHRCVQVIHVRRHCSLFVRAPVRSRRRVAVDVVGGGIRRVVGPWLHLLRPRRAPSRDCACARGVVGLDCARLLSVGPALLADA